MNEIPDDLDPIEYLAFVGRQESQKISPASTWSDDLHQRMQGNVKQIGSCLPWGKTHNLIRLRPGEVSIWAGVNGHRKSMITGQVALWLAKVQRVGIASLEMQPGATLERMCKQAAGAGNPSKEFVDRFLGWSHERIWLYDKLDTTPADSILGVAYYMARELGIKHVFIDSLMKCGIAGDDYEGQKRFIDRLSLCAKQNHIHVHLVAHMRKGNTEADKPGKFSIKGASEITDLADNVFICWKDKVREEAAAKQDMGHSLSDAELKALDRCDQVLDVAKQRHGEWEGMFNLWFHRASLQFLGKESDTAMPFNLESERAA